jgi:hypothetical protein
METAPKTAAVHSVSAAFEAHARSKRLTSGDRSGCAAVSSPSLDAGASALAARLLGGS